MGLGVAPLPPQGPRQGKTRYVCPTARAFAMFVTFVFVFILSLQCRCYFVLPLKFSDFS